MMTNLNLTDMEPCYKAFRREVIQSIERGGDLQDIAFISEEGDDTHLTFAAGTLEGVNFKDALHAARPTYRWGRARLCWVI